MGLEQAGSVVMSVASFEDHFSSGEIIRWMEVLQHASGEDSLSREEPWRGLRLEVSSLLVVWLFGAFKAGLGSTVLSLCTKEASE